MCLWVFLDEAKSLFKNVRGLDISEDGINHAKNTLNLDVKSTEFTELEAKESVDAGCRTILIKSQYEEKQADNPDCIAVSLLDAVSYIMSLSKEQQ